LSAAVLPGDLPGVATYLASATELAVRLLPGVAAASVTLLAGPEPQTPAHTGALALYLDLAQYRLGGGPCMHAAVAGELVEVVDALEDRRWPGYAEAAAARGSRSSLSVPLHLSGEPAGALNLYGEGAAAFADAEVRRSAGHVGETAAAGLTALLELAGAAARAGNLETAMDSRAVIEQAKGILMERRRVTADGAFELLKDASQHTNRKLRDIADHLVATGELLGH
jgi:GAF domain-containing protein